MTLVTRARLAGVVAVAGTIATGIVYAMSVLVAPMPWPWLFAGVWLAFVIISVLTAHRWPVRALIVPLIALGVGLAWLEMGKQLSSWSP